MNLVYLKMNVVIFLNLLIKRNFKKKYVKPHLYRIMKVNLVME